MRKWVLIWGYVLIIAGVVVAQQGDCELIVRQALAGVDNICQGLDRNQACYGKVTVERTPRDEAMGNDFFMQPGDQENLADFEMIRPSPMNVETGEFGVTLLNVQANVPNTSSGSAVLFLLIGDASLSNEIAPDASDQTAFQSFYFQPGTGNAPCYEAEPTLTIQTPGNITTTLYLNGVETDMSPGTLLTITPNVCTIHRGNIIQRTPDGEIAAVLLANETVDIFIDDDGAVNVTNKRGISEREYVRGELIQQSINSISAQNEWQAQYLVPPAKFDEEPLAPAQSIAGNVDASDVVIVTDSDSSSASNASSSSSDCDTQHTVRSGETLHMIAQRYDTSVVGVSEFNGLSNPRVIFPGQVLCIPNVGSGFEALPAGS